jgi:hypothetical protein
VCPSARRLCGLENFAERRWPSSAWVRAEVHIKTSKILVISSILADLGSTKTLMLPLRHRSQTFHRDGCERREPSCFQQRSQACDDRRAEACDAELSIEVHREAGGGPMSGYSVQPGGLVPNIKTSSARDHDLLAKLSRGTLPCRFLARIVKRIVHHRAVGYHIIQGCQAFGQGDISIYISKMFGMPLHASIASHRAVNSP